MSSGASLEALVIDKMVSVLGVCWTTMAVPPALGLWAPCPQLCESWVCSGANCWRLAGKGGCDCAGSMLPSSQELGRSCNLAGGNLSQEATSPPEGKEDVPSNSAWRTPWRMGPLASGRLRTLVRGMLVPSRVVALPDPEVTSE